MISRVNVPWNSRIVTCYDIKRIIVLSQGAEKKRVISKDILTTIPFVTRVKAVEIVIAEEALIDTDAVVAG